MSTCTTLRTLAVGGATLVLLTSCGGGNTEDRKDLSPPAAASSAERPSGGKQASGVGGGRAAGSEETAESRTNERGNVVKALGEEGGVVGETGTQLLTFAVDAITVDPACSADWQEYGTPVEPGHHLVAVQLRVATSPAASEEDYLSVSSYDFKYIGADGITVDELSSMATYGCLDDGQYFTSDTLGPGQKYVGAVVLDLPSATGTLVFDPYWGQTGGWEYTF